MGHKRLDVLESILKQVIDWLKFAEAKNGALVAVCCTTFFGSYRVYSTLSEERFRAIGPVASSAKTI